MTGTFVDYALPSAAELPSFETDRTETPSPVNSLHVKGVGEAGTIAGSAAVTNAVIDALKPVGVTYMNMPLSPMRVWQAIQMREGRCPGVIPAEFDYDRDPPSRLDAALSRAARGRRGRQAARGRPLAAAADEAAAGSADAARGPAQRPGPLRHPAQRRRDDRRDDAPPRRGERLRARARGAGGGTIADQQVRNRGTIGGSLAHGDPASDMPAVLLAAEGSVTVRGGSGERQIAAADLFQDYLTTTIADDEVLTECHLPDMDGFGHGYAEVQPPHRGLGDGRRVHARQARGRRLVRGRAHRAH